MLATRLESAMPRRGSPGTPPRGSSSSGRGPVHETRQHETPREMEGSWSVFVRAGDAADGDGVDAAWLG